jgi:hypothetical protein
MNATANGAFAAIASATIGAPTTTRLTGPSRMARAASISAS